MITSMLRRAQLSGDGSTLTLDFTTGVLDPRLTFDRTSTATFINSSGLVQFANANLMTYSTPRASGSAWLTTGTVTWGSATIAAPNGAATAQEVTFGTTGSAIFNSAGTTVTSGITHTFSVWLRAATGTTNVRLGSANAVGSPVTLTTTWQRFSIQYTTVNATDGGAVYSQTGTPSATFYVWGAQLQPGSTVGELLETTGSLRRNTPRFDHDPTTLAPRGLLIEGQAVNAFNHSETFNSTGSGTLWGYSDVTRNASLITGPDGLSSAYQFNETTANAIHRLSYPVIGTIGNSATISVWVKVLSTTTPRRVYLNALNYMGVGACFEIDPAVQTGASGNSLTVDGTAANRSGTWVKYANDWYRCVVVGTVAAASQTFYIQINRNTTTVNGDTYAGSTSNGLALWGAQLETGSGASSYIPTGASQVTRTGDICFMTGTNFSSWWNPQEGTVFAETAATTVATSTANRVFSVTVFGNIGFQIGATFVYDNSTFRITDSASSASKHAVALKTNDFAISNGTSAIRTGTGALGTTYDRLQIGSYEQPTSWLNGCIRRFKYWPTRLPDAQLQSLTT